MDIYSRLEKPSLLSNRSRGSVICASRGTSTGARGWRAVLCWVLGGVHLQTNLTLGCKSESDFLGER